MLLTHDQMIQVLECITIALDRYLTSLREETLTVSDPLTAGESTPPALPPPAEAVPEGEADLALLQVLMPCYSEWLENPPPVEVGFWRPAGTPAMSLPYVRGELRKAGLSDESVMREWEARGWITAREGRLTDVVRIPGTRKNARMVSFTVLGLQAVGGEVLFELERLPSAKASEPRDYTSRIDLLTYTEVARRLGMDPKRVGAAVRNGELPSVPYGKGRRIPAGALRSLIKSSRHRS